MVSGRGRPRLGHVPALDGLRGLAIACVLAGHFADVAGGALGVDLFFCLSGFLITTLLLEELDEVGRISLVGFYARRCRRLLPALAALLVAYAVVALALGRSLLAILEGGFYTANIAQAFFHPAELAASGLTHLWSLAEEEQFYALWPLAFLLLVRRSRPERWLVAALAALVAYRVALAVAGASHLRLYMGTDTHADGLIAGALLAFLRWRGVQVAWLAKLSVLFFVAIWLRGFLFAHGVSGGWDAYGLPIAELGAVGLVASALSSEGVLTARPCVGLGRISYSLYLWHVPVLWLFGGERLVALVLSFAAAVASYRFVESPFRRRRPLRRAREAHRAEVGGAASVGAGLVAD